MSSSKVAPPRSCSALAWALGFAAGPLACGGGPQVEDGGASGGLGLVSGDVGGGASSGGESTGGDGDGSGTGSSGSTGDSGGSGAMDPEGPRFDLGIAPDFPASEPGCTKVDFLFVIDNSGSMEAHQSNLIANFPGFIAGIQDTLGSVDSYQVGVLTTDTYKYNKDGCKALSSLVVQTGGSDSSHSLCAGPGGLFAAGGHFMTEADDLAQTFVCAAQVGTAGSGYERPMQAAIEATQRLDGGPGQCNEGFLRDDSLLVLVVITDEADGPGDLEGPPPATSEGDPQSWYNALVSARGGLAENIVVLTLTQYPGGPCPPQSPFENGQNLVDFTELFGVNGFVGGICLDYAPLFQAATAVIDDACANFVPPG